MKHENVDGPNRKSIDQSAFWNRAHRLKGFAHLLVAVVALGGVVVYTAHASGRSDREADPVFGITIPPGYREWKLISVAREEGNLNDLRALLGNDVAIKAYRSGKPPFEENNNVFGRSQSFVAGPATNVQFMVKNSKKYVATGGWGFGHFGTDGKPGDAAFMKSCCRATRRRQRPIVSFLATHRDAGN